jgi:hypothetical protein
VNPVRDASGGKDKAPPLRMGRLVLVCIAVWIFCGALTWFAFSYLDDCCDMSMFSRFFH